MSHYTVLIMGKNPEDQLDPFYEQTEDKQYLEFFDAEKEYLKDYEDGTKTSSEWYPSTDMWLSKAELKELLVTGELHLVKHAPDRYFCTGDLKRDNNDHIKKSSVRLKEWDDEEGAKNTDYYAEVTHWKREYTDDFKAQLLEDLKKDPPQGKEDAYKILAERLSKSKDGFYIYEASLKLIDPPRQIPLNETYPDFKQYLEEWHGEEIDEETGKYGHWKNPNAKWDWYELGGRWAGTFTLKNGDISDQALKKDIDFEQMKKNQREEAERLWDETEEMIAEAAKEDKDISWELSFQYGRKKGMTREEYIEGSVGFSTFAVLKDGKWYERGQMGWWAMVADEKDRDVWDDEVTKLLESTSDDTLLSMYDCHI